MLIKHTLKPKKILKKAAHNTADLAIMSGCLIALGVVYTYTFYIEWFTPDN